MEDELLKDDMRILAAAMKRERGITWSEVVVEKDGNQTGCIASGLQSKNARRDDVEQKTVSKPHSSRQNT